MAELHRQSSNENQKSTDNRFIEIIEQPASVRYRYECEGRTAGSILGVNSSNEHKTYPTIKINGYKGTVIIVVSCVTKDKPYRPHPYRLVGEFCKDGIFKAVINNESMTISLRHVGIQCVRRSEVDKALKEREKRQINPFLTNNSKRDFDYNTVKLCFQAIIKDQQTGHPYLFQPVVSDNVPDKKMMTDLRIHRLSHASASVNGKTEVILLCEKVIKDDIQIVFFEMKNGKRIWESLADFKPSDVFKQMAICFKTPKYYNLDIKNPVHVQIQLRIPSVGKSGKCYPFILIPNSGIRSITPADNIFNHSPSNPENIFPSRGGFGPNPNVSQILPRHLYPTNSLQTIQPRNEDSNTFYDQTTLQIQPSTDQQPNIPEGFNTIASGNINNFGSISKELIQNSSYNSIYNQYSPTYPSTDLSIQNEFFWKDGPSTSASVTSQMPPNPTISSGMDGLIPHSTENNLPTNDMDTLSSNLSDINNTSFEELLNTLLV